MRNEGPCNSFKCISLTAQYLHNLLPLFLNDVIFVFGHPYFFIFCLACLAVVHRGVDLQFQQAKWGARGVICDRLHTRTQKTLTLTNCNLWLPQSSRTVCPEESVHDTCTSHLQCLRVLSWGGGDCGSSGHAYNVICNICTLGISFDLHKVPPPNSSTLFPLGALDSGITQLTKRVKPHEG